MIGRLVDKNNVIYFVDETDERVVVDLSINVMRKNPKAFIAINEGYTSTINTINVVGTEHSAYCSDEEQYGYMAHCMLVNLLIINDATKNYRPYNCLEVGCNSGVLSCHLSQILDSINSDNRLCGMSDGKYDNEGRTVLKKISSLKTANNFYYILQDYEHNMLQKKYFNTVVINGTTKFSNPKIIIENAVETVKDNGLIIAVVHNQPLLESVFKLMFDNCEVYSFSEGEVVMTAKPADLWDYKQTKSLILEELKDILTDSESLDKNVAILKSCLEEKMYVDREEKALIIELKDAIITYRLNLTDKHKKYYLENLHKAYDALQCYNAGNQG